MPEKRSQVKPTIPPTVCAAAKVRAKGLGCSSLSSYFEALVRADLERPTPGLAAKVAAIELEMSGTKADAARSSLESVRASKHTPTDE
jgi:hypothetical protein